jgi:hypothetical protein
MNQAVKTAALSLNDLNIAKKCEGTYEFEYVKPSTGKGTGVFITVIGSQAPKVQNWIRKTLNDRRSREAMLVKRGKEITRTVEDDEEFSNEAAAIRVVGWRGITEEYDHDLAVQLVSTNPEIRDQVFEASNDLSHFTKG